MLPLENLSRDPDQTYFTDGMIEALITEFAHISALKVTSRTSIMTYKTSQKTAPEIARDLDVEGILTGSVQRAGDRVGISVQLVDARNDRNLWTRSFERDLREVLSLQRDIARQITEEIQVALTPQEAAHVTRRSVVEPKAYQLYVKGRYFWDKRNEDAMRVAVDCFKQAIDIDPGYALAYAGLADCYLFQSPLPRSESMAAARAAALRALQIDSTLSEAHTTLGFVNMNYDWDWLGAYRELRLATELNPNNAIAH